MVLEVGTCTKIKKLMDSDDAKYIELPKPRPKKEEVVVVDKVVEVEETGQPIDIPLDDTAFEGDLPLSAELQLDADGNPIPPENAIPGEGEALQQ